MDAHALSWLALVARWIHLIAGIAWIGASFYFVWLDISLEKPRRDNPRLAGELWAIHGGGFYEVAKYKVAPEKLPERLHWFYWEAYGTWLSGFVLLLLMFWLRPGLLVEAGGPLAHGPAAWVCAGSLVVGFVAYSALCRALSSWPRALALTGFAGIAGTAWGYQQFLSPRAAFLHVGALLGTIMAANVAHVIIPNQRKAVAAMIAGQEPDPSLGASAKLRSLHNNYITLPVLFLMISNHFPQTYAHPHAWAVMLGIALAGAVVRHGTNLKNRGQPWGWTAPVAVVLLVAIGLWTAPRHGQGTAQGAAVTDAEGMRIVSARCAACHSESPTNPAFPVAPLGLMLDTAEQVRARKADVVDRALVRKDMPLGNLTGLTDAEREVLARWLR